MSKFEKIFGTKRPLIGMIHLLPTIGYKGFVSYQEVLDAALADLENLQNAGYDAVIVENNYDLPHEIFVKPESIAILTKLLGDLLPHAKIPVGLSVLWNDYKTELALAKLFNIKFFRVPVFVDRVKTSYGVVEPGAEDLENYAETLGVDLAEVAIFTDIHVKHSEILSTHTIVESAKMAIDAGSDALIITGKWTADAPNTDDLQTVRSAVGDFPIAIGSGATEQNLPLLTKYADAIIVGTAIKTGVNHSAKEEVNIKTEYERIDFAKAEIFATKYSDSIKEK